MTAALDMIDRSFLLMWTGCDEALPPDGEKVLVVIENGRNGNGGPRRIDVATAKTRKVFDREMVEVTTTMFVVGTGSYLPSRVEGWRKHVSAWASLPHPPMRPTHVGDDRAPAPAPIDFGKMGAILTSLADGLQRIERTSV